MNFIFTRPIQIALVLCLLSGCLVSPPKQGVVAQELHSPSELNQNGVEYNGKEVLVRGYLFEEGDLICLVDKRISNRTEIAKNGAITVIGLENLRPRSKDYAGTDITFVARYGSNLLNPGEVLMAGCGQRGVRIETIQRPR